jgi:hypothetical protein
MSKQDNDKPLSKPAPQAEKLPPDVWCQRLGKFAPGKQSKDGSVVLSPAIPAWQHGAAAGLHAWELHEHHAGGPLLVTESDYLAALKAAEGPTYEPHKPALSPYAPWAPKE